MTNTSSSSESESQPAMSYPTQQQYARWKARAAELDMSVSEFMQSMIEAGIKVDKGFELQLEADESRRDLREQRNDLKDELAHARNRIETLENRLHDSERETVRKFVEQNPGVIQAEIVQRVADTAHERVNQHLEALEGDAVRVKDDAYLPADTEETDHRTDP